MFVLGGLFGHLMHRYSRDLKSTEQFKEWVFTTKKVHAKRAESPTASFIQNGSSNLNRSGHEPRKEGRPGLSIKKDLSIQFRNYTPRKVFLNCGGTYPWTVDLFLDTYPAANEFEIITFLPDKTYAIMYYDFPNHTVHAPVVVSTRNGTETRNNQGFGYGAAVTEEISFLDIGQWIKDSFHEDDHVILKLESDHEKEIINYIVKIDALEHIDKYYTATKNLDILDHAKGKFKVRGVPVEHWDAKAGNYGDFDKHNPSRIPGGGGYLKSCQVKSKPENFVLMLYASHPSTRVIRAISMLRSFFKESQHPVTVFLPVSYFLNYISDSHVIFESCNVGLFIPGDKNFTQNVLGGYCWMRNSAVVAQRRFDKFEKIVQYLLIQEGTNEASVHKLVKERKFTVFKASREISGIFSQIEDGKTPTINDIRQNAEDYLTLDLTKVGADYLALYMVRRFAPFLSPLSDCLGANI
ncbi:hypothetical protein CHS0354_006470 [Potamilus streckersoni]|uniref:Uncharacterized protein n=1 Tax=Potamilus streckersoni TaxID=2493646 RepID=A0AAE0WA63_9BIVA|nr:hypothetical protein CHS0354_006470 [Potamilus streckersoni]